MSFILLSHGQSHLKLASIDGHRLLFNVICTGDARHVACGAIEWSAGRQPDNSSAFLAMATSFASVCAQDYGLI